MAVLKPSIFGQMTGRIGNVVIYMLNGQIVCRTIGEQKKPATNKQNGNRSEMGLLMPVLKSLQKFIKHGFEHQAKGTVCNPFNLATSYNKQNAIAGEYPNLNINYKELKLSSGALPLAKDLQISKTADGLKVSWNPIHQWAGDQYDDLVMIALYHPKDKNASLFFNAGKRSEGECFLDVPDKNLLNEPLEAYLCFKSADGESISDSVYLGNMNGKVMTTEEQELYDLAVAALAVSQQSFEKQEQKFIDTGNKTKAYKNLDKECQVWRDRMFQLSGRPG